MQKLIKTPALMPSSRKQFTHHLLSMSTCERLHEKTNILHMRNKDAHQLRSNHEANQPLCFRYTNSTIPLISKSKISSLVVVHPGVGPGQKPECWFSHDAAHMLFTEHIRIQVETARVH